MDKITGFITMEFGITTSAWDNQWYSEKNCWNKECALLLSEEKNCVLRKLVIIGRRTNLIGSWNITWFWTNFQATVDKRSLRGSQSNNKRFFSLLNRKTRSAFHMQKDTTGTMWVRMVKIVQMQGYSKHSKIVDLILWINK